MIEWKKQGVAVTGELVLANGESGMIVLVAPRDNPKGATVIIPGDTPDNPAMKPLAEVVANLAPQTLVDVMVMQERCFGTTGLPAPPALT